MKKHRGEGGGLISIEGFITGSKKHKANLTNDDSAVIGSDQSRRLQ